MSKACEHEYRQIMLYPESPQGRNFEIQFYCIKCLWITGAIDL